MVCIRTPLPLVKVLQRAFAFIRKQGLGRYFGIRTKDRGDLGSPRLSASLSFTELQSMISEM